jgi:hypothetical protein
MRRFYVRPASEIPEVPPEPEAPREEIYYSSPPPPDDAYDDPPLDNVVADLPDVGFDDFPPDDEPPCDLFGRTEAELRGAIKWQEEVLVIRESFSGSNENYHIRTSAMRANLDVDRRQLDTLLADAGTELF